MQGAQNPEQPTRLQCNEPRFPVANARDYTASHLEGRRHHISTSFYVRPAEPFLQMPTAETMLMSMWCFASPYSRFLCPQARISLDLYPLLS